MDRSRAAEPPEESGYAVGRLWDALHSAATLGNAAARARAAAKVERWRSVLDGMASGGLAIGSRTPVADTPVWATLEVVTGGFATGHLLADQPLDSAEWARLDALPPGPGRTDRERLNLHYLTDEGQAELLAALAEERYRIDLPEHAALAVVALLVERHRPEQALDLVTALRPLMDRLRFTPVFTDRPIGAGESVHLVRVGEVAEALRDRSVPGQLVAMRETLSVWNPLYDDLIALWADTVEGDLPHLVDGAVVGGQPAGHFLDGWAARRTRWLDRYLAAERAAATPSRHRHAKSTFTWLRRALEDGGADGSGLTGRDIGRIRRALAGAVTRYGAPGSDTHTASRASQAEEIARPTHAQVAWAVAKRLDRYPADGGLPDLDPVVADVTPAEHPELGADAPVPPSVRTRVLRALEAPVDELVAHGVITSSEVLASVLPQVSARYVSGSIDDPVVAGLHARTYTAFRRRRGVLLLNLESQVGFHELPWVGPMQDFRTSGRSGRPAGQALRRAVLLALRSFPAQILPNPLVREIGALARAADVRLPLVEELAADIFMDEFTDKWERAARIASRVLEGTLYARYYDLPRPSDWPVEQPRVTLWERTRGRASNSFGELCRARAVEAGKKRGWSVAGNGAVLEQSQILTTHNLAVLAAELDLLPVLRDQAPDLVDRILAELLRGWDRLPQEHHPRLTTIKNIAYSWRQAVYFLSLCDDERQAVVVADLRAATASGRRAALRPVVDGLATVLDGGRFTAEGLTADGRGKRLLGWSLGPHWLVEMLDSAR
ncbi:hypothetical protein V5P93_000034 [Actinokineospora auranticolor]|uniref:Uncharacterized protein n=1 Tax=Actinokineospora auranticolor TaxID=155976 RepID=A0A2S6GSE3_9PSEU|nr:hypothetical protein [Actinokineospora auranticolor]PPK68130.1 hypothetical protein CLV40_106367 [Actinokineospora auranticolor]